MVVTTYIDNRKAHFNYEIIETYEAGIELLGHEVKALKNAMGNIAGAFCIVRSGEVFIVGMNIPAYQPKNNKEDYDPDRTRKLLLSKKEIAVLADIDKGKNLTLVPLSLYSKGRRIKLSIAVAKGKKMHDKRESIKKRDTDREIRREYKR